jgi:hypothetical protein
MVFAGAKRNLVFLPDRLNQRGCGRISIGRSGRRELQRSDWD